MARAAGRRTQDLFYLITWETGYYLKTWKNTEKKPRFQTSQKCRANLYPGPHRCGVGSKLAEVPGWFALIVTLAKACTHAQWQQMEEREEFFHAIDFVPRMVAMLNRTRALNSACSIPVTSKTSAWG